MQPRTVTLHLAIGAITHGIWCDRCLTSSVHSAGVYALHDDGPHRLTTATVCARCEGYE